MTKSEKHGSKQLAQLAQYSQALTWTSSLNVPFGSSVSDSQCVLLLFGLGSSLPVASVLLAMGALCFEGHLMCTSSCEVLLWTSLKIISSDCEGEEESGWSPDPNRDGRAAEFLSDLLTDLVVEVGLFCFVFSKISCYLGENWALDSGLLLFQHDNQPFQWCPWLTAKCSLTVKNPRG